MAVKKDQKKSRVTSFISEAALQQLNKWLALVFAAQGLVILILSDGRPYPVSVSFLGLDTLQSRAQGNSVVVAGSQTIFNVNLTLLVAIFLFVAAVAHGLLATKLKRNYEKAIRKRVNPIRWVEYAISGGIMVLATSVLVGVQDLSTLLMLFGLTALMYVIWMGVELYNSTSAKPSHVGFVVGCIAGALPWVVMAIYLISSAVYGISTPAYVYWIYGTMLVLFSCFGANMYMQTRKAGRWSKYAYGEWVFMITSLAAKTLLAWQIFAGVLHP